MEARDDGPRIRLVPWIADCVLLRAVATAIELPFLVSATATSYLHRCRSCGRAIEIGGEVCESLFLTVVVFARAIIGGAVREREKTWAEHLLSMPAFHTAHHKHAPFATRSRTPQHKGPGASVPVHRR
jgi:hypothetical protein